MILLGILAASRRVLSVAKTIGFFTQSGSTDKYPYATLTRSTVAAGTAGQSFSRGISGPLAGYTFGQFPTGNTIGKFIFATSVASTLAANTDPASFAISPAESTTTGYLIGGARDPGADYSTVNKISFATDTKSAGTNLAVTKGEAGTGMTSTQIFIAGGNTSSSQPSSRVDTYTFATDTTTGLGNILSASTIHGGSDFTNNLLFLMQYGDSNPIQQFNMTNNTVSVLGFTTGFGTSFSNRYINSASDQVGLILMTVVGLTPNSGLRSFNTITSTTATETSLSSADRRGLTN
jgi:hypothetical protein